MQTKPQILMFSNGRWDISSFIAFFVDKFEKWKYTESDIYTRTGFRYFPCWREKYWRKCFKRDHLLIIKPWKSFKIAHLYKRLISSISDQEQNKLYKMFFILFFVYVYAQVPGFSHACHKGIRPLRIGILQMVVSQQIGTGNWTFNHCKNGRCS